MNCACAILSSVACRALQYFYTLSNERRGFGMRKTFSDIKCVLMFLFFLQILLPETFFTLRRTERNVIKMCIGRTAACKVAVIGV
jgi:hypothetical protein